MSFYDNRYYHLNKRFLSIIGQWPSQSRLKGNLLLGSSLFFICSFMGLELWGLIRGIRDLSIVMENVSPLLVDNLALIKLISCACHKKQMQELLMRVEETWKEIQVGPENEILRKYAEQARMFTMQYSIGLFSMGTFYWTMPFVVSKLYSFLPTNVTYSARFLYRIEHVLDIDKYFNLLMLHTFVTIFYLGSVMTAVDGMFTLCIEHICALFEGVRYNMNRIRGTDVLKPDIKDDEAYHIIIGCVKSYNRAIKYSDLVSSTFASTFLIILGNVVISLSFGAAELIMVNAQLDEIIRIMAANIAVLIHTFYASLMCQRLIDHSSELHEVIYSCNWYRISLRSRQLLRFMLLRATRPCQIKAGKMYVMSMENFSAILKVSMSYFTMLTSIE